MSATSSGLRRAEKVGLQFIVVGLVWLAVAVFLFFLLEALRLTPSRPESVDVGLNRETLSLMIYYVDSLVVYHGYFEGAPLLIVIGVVIWLVSKVFSAASTLKAGGGSICKETQPDSQAVSRPAMTHATNSERTTFLAMIIHRTAAASFVVLCVDLCSELLLLGWVLWCPVGEQDRGLFLSLVVLSYALTAALVLCSAMVAGLALLVLFMRRRPRAFDLCVAGVSLVAGLALHFLAPVVGAWLR